MTNWLPSWTLLTSQDIGATRSGPIWTTKVLSTFDLLADCWFSNSSVFLSSPFCLQGWRICPHHVLNLTLSLKKSFISFHLFLQCCITFLLWLSFVYLSLTTFILFSIISFLQLELLIDKWVPLLCYLFLYSCSCHGVTVSALSARFSPGLFDTEGRADPQKKGSLKWQNNDPVFLPLRGLLPSGIPNYPRSYSQDLNAIRKRFSARDREREGGCTWEEMERLQSH